MSLKSLMRNIPRKCTLAFPGQFNLSILPWQENMALEPIEQLLNAPVVDQAHTRMEGRQGGRTVLPRGNGEREQASYRNLRSRSKVISEAYLTSSALTNWRMQVLGTKLQWDLSGAPNRIFKGYLELISRLIFHMFMLLVTLRGYLKRDRSNSE